MNVLLAEDDDELAEMMVLLIQQATCNIKVVRKSDGIPALEEFKNCCGSVNNDNRYSFVITDRNMPKMSGLELAENLKLLDPSIPIVLWTSDPILPPNTSHLFKEVVLKADTIPWIDYGLKTYLQH